MTISQAVLDQLDLRLAAVQAEQRLPSLVLAVARGGEMVHQLALGVASQRTGLGASSAVQYRIGSITKTVTAVAVMQLVEAGQLDLEAPLSQGWKGAPYDDLSLSQLLSHGSGLQREPVGAVWEDFRFPAREELAAAALEARRLYPAGHWFHYSNLAYALLGELVAQRRRTSWEAYVGDHILGPLGMVRTGVVPASPAAQGYSVAPYSDEALEELPVDCRGLTPAGQLWSTAEDLCRWSGVLAGCRPDVLAAAALERMRAPRTIADLDHWREGFGLGLMLLRDGDAIYQGHLGAMPGFLAAVLCHQGSGVGVVLLTNASAGVELGPLAVEVLGKVRAATRVPEWVPGERPPERIRPLLGHWWSEWREWSFSWCGGGLEARPVGAPRDEPPTRFEELADGDFVATNGTERGERLQVVRDEAESPGGITKLYWATYPFTREPSTFGGPR